ncbi:MAG: hypothetical protein KAU48_03330, partial [Candidatus Thorarchaeota archaeon]|nr:hypothetical protein [Candidatus Thorarchaeota archaeon]
SDNPNLILDSGNYLFLSLLMVKYTHPTISDEILATIWLSLKSWQLLQLGFVSDENVSGRPTFDLESICNDLALRIACLQESPSPITPSVRYGRVIVVEAEEEGYDFWFLLQRQSKSADMIVGMWRNDNPIEQSNRFHWSVNRSDVLAASAKQAKSPIEYDDVAVITSGGKSYLWTRIGDIWNIVGSIEIIQKRSEELQLIRGVRVNPFGTETIRNNSFRSITDNELSKLVETNLERIQDIAASCIAVECTINLDSENYILDLHSSEAGEKVVYEQLVFERTKELVDFLRTPLTKGAPVEVHSEKSLRYTWNPYLNIDYGELEILKPFVERKKPFSRTGFSLPQFAIDIIQDEPIPVHLTIKHDLNLCPIWHEINDDHAACWMLEGGDATPNAILSILSEGLTDIEIGEFLKTSDFHFQGNRYRVLIQFPEDDERIVFRESRVFARHLCEKKVPPSSFLRLSEETLECKIFQESNIIITTVKSDITGDTIYSGPLIKLSKDMDTQHALEYVEEVFEHIIDNRYSSEPEINRIQFYDELLVKVKELIGEYVSA